jgi:hypothetical protein
MTHTLTQRFPGLSTLGTADLLGPLPNPVEALVRLSRMTGSDLFIKRSRVASGDCSPEAPTDADMQHSHIRLLSVRGSLASV